MKRSDSRSNVRRRASAISLFRLRLELDRSNEQMEEYRQYLRLINETRRTTHIDDLSPIDYSDDDCSRIEKNFCLDDHKEKKLIFLYSKPSLPPSDDDDDDCLSTLSHLDHDVE
jgi:hypothetical protein